MTRCDVLRNHPAHARPDDVRSLDTERVEQADAIVGHVGQRIGHLGREADLRQQRHLDEAGGFHPVELLAQSDIAIVVTNHAETLRSQGLDQFVGPQRQLRPEAHDQQHRGRSRIALFLVMDLVPVGRRLGHSPFPPRISARPTSTDCANLVQRESRRGRRAAA